MSCRCNDISLCEEDLNTLKTMLQRLGDLSWDDETISNRLYLLSEYCNGSITPDNLATLTSIQSDLHNKLHENTLHMEELCQFEIQRLEQKLERMEREDERYHEEEDSDD